MSKEWKTTDTGLGALLAFIDPDSLAYAECTGNKVELTFHDNCTDGKGCQWIRDLYFSKEGARINDLRAYNRCYAEVLRFVKAAKSLRAGEVLEWSDFKYQL